MDILRGTTSLTEKRWLEVTCNDISTTECFKSSETERTSYIVSVEEGTIPSFPPKGFSSVLGLLQHPNAQSGAQSL